MARSESYNLKRRLARRVRRGVIFLNKMHPGWEDRIDLDRFNINNISDCICGQLDIQFMPAITNENPTDRTLEMDSGLGFFVKEENPWGPYTRIPVLNDLWKAEIKAIREAKAAKEKAEAEAAAAKFEADKAETFGNVVDGLIGQKLEPSMSEIGCAYRGDNDRKCAAGQLIPDCDYNPSWENTGVFVSRHGDHNAVTTYFLNKYENDELVKMISKCQNAHDNYLKVRAKYTWAKEMLSIYNNFGVNSPIHKAKLETVVALFE